MQNKGLVIGVVVVAVLAVGGYFLFSSNSLPSPSQVSTESQPDSIASQEVPANSSPDLGEIAVGEEESVKEIVIEGNEFSFSPKSLTVIQGEKVRLTFKNVGKFPHNFVIDELGVSTKTIPAGATEVVEFTAEKSGSFKFYCSVGNHRTQGMEGDLSVD